MVEKKHSHLILRFMALSLIVLSNSFTLLSQNPAHFILGENELSNTNIYSIKKQPNGYLYAATNYGLFAYKNGRFQNIEWNCEHIGSSIFSLQFDSKNNLYCVNLSGQIFRLTNDSLQLHASVPNEYINARGIDFVFDGEGNIIVRSGVLLSFKDEKWEVIRNNAGSVLNFNTYNPDRILFTVVDSSLVSAIENRRILQIEGNSPVSKRKQFGRSYPIEVRDELFFVTIDGELVNWGTNKSINLDVGRCHMIRQTEEFGAWVLSQSSGAYSLNFEGEELKRSPHYFQDYFISSIYQTKDGTVYLGTFGNGVIVVPSQSANVYSTTVRSINHISVLKGDESERRTLLSFDSIQPLNSNSSILVGNKMIAKISGVDFELSDEYPSLFAQEEITSLSTGHFGAVKDIIEVKKGTALCATSYGIFKVGKGLDHINWIQNGAGDQWWRLKPVLFRCSAVAYIESTNEILYASKNGVFLVDSEGKEKEITLHGVSLISFDIFASEDQFICGTHEHGILYVRNGKIVKQITTKDGLRDNFIESVKVHNGKLYVSSKTGFQILDLETNRWNSLGRYSRSVNGEVSTFVIDENVLWLASKDRLISIPLSELQEAAKFDFQLIRFSLGDLIFDSKEKIKTSYENNRLKVNFDFKGILYEEDALIEYRMNGGDWKQLPATASELEFESLSPGAYNLEFRLNYFGVYSHQNSIQFDIVPPFWQTWWFFVIIIVFTVLIVVFLFKRRVQKQQSKQRLITEGLESELKALRSQMNPHFIFNSLNSIQDLVMRQDTRKTYDYIVLFSKLVRNTLNYSSLEFITIDKEIEFLEVYLSLEKLRFQKDFEYSISYDGREDLELPSLLIQPFLENALVHGLIHKKGLKKLQIEFIVNDHLECRIRDNGIGRKRAKEILDRQRGDHKSFATEAIEQRLHLLNEQLGTEEAYYKVIDLEKDGVAIGTEVIVNLPLKIDD